VGDFLDAEPSEKSQFHQPRVVRIQFVEPPKDFIQRERVDRRRARRGHVGHAQVHALTLAFGGGLAARVVDQHLTHRLGGDGAEMRPAFPTVARADQLDVSLMHDGRRLKRMTGRLIAKVVPRLGAQLLVHQRQQLDRGRRIAIVDAPEQQRGRPRIVRVGWMGIGEHDAPIIAGLPGQNTRKLRLGGSKSAWGRLF